MNKYLKFSNKNAIGENSIQKLLYILGYFFALIAKLFGLTPNGLTLISFLCALLAFASLVISNLYSFVTFWFVAYILDYADGTLARMTNSKGKTALRYDHFSDLLKILLIFLGFALYYDNQIIWILTFGATSLYLFYTILNHELGNVIKLTNMYKRLLKIKESKNYNNKTLNKKKLKIIDQIKLFIKKKPFLKNFILNFFNIFLTINGHTLLIFFFIPISSSFAIILLTYFILITTFHIILRAKKLNKLQKINI